MKHQKKNIYIYIQQAKSEVEALQEKYRLDMEMYRKTIDRLESQIIEERKTLPEIHQRVINQEEDRLKRVEENFKKEREHLKILQDSHAVSL